MGKDVSLLQGDAKVLRVVSLVRKERDEWKKEQMKVSVKEIKVLKKYPLKVIVRFTTKITKTSLEISEANFMIAMDEDIFADFFPHTFTHLIFKKLLDVKAQQWITFAEFSSKVPSLIRSYGTVTPQLSYTKPYVVFMERSGFFETRRRLAQYLRIVEAFEKKLDDEETKIQ